MLKCAHVPRFRRPGRAWALFFPVPLDMSHAFLHTGCMTTTADIARTLLNSLVFETPRHLQGQAHQVAEAGVKIRGRFHTVRRITDATVLAADGRPTTRYELVLASSTVTL